MANLSAKTTVPNWQRPQRYNMEECAAIQNDASSNHQTSGAIRIDLSDIAGQLACPLFSPCERKTKFGG